MTNRQKITAALGLVAALCVGLFGPYTVGGNAAAGFALALGVASTCSPVAWSPVLYANTGLTTLLPIAVQALDVVSREMVGMIPSVNRDPTADRLAKNQTLYSWVTGAASIGDIVPGNVVPQAPDRALGARTIALSNFKNSPFYFTGEEEKQLGVTGSYGGIVADTIEQAIRTIVNQMESDLSLAASIGASRAFGVVGTTPFATNVGESAQVRKILDDNGAPAGTRSLVIDTTTGASLRTLSNLTKANEAGTTMTLRDGELLNLNGLSIKESAGIVQSPAVGTAAGATTDAAGYAGQLTGAGATVINLAAAGTGTILAGDVITFAGDTNKYVVAVGNASVAGGGSITLAAPGLRKPMSANAKAITVLGSGPRNIALSRNAMLLATRLPARPSGGDLATDVAVITDARSGMSVELSMYPQYRQVYYEVAAAWGVTVIKSEHLALLLG